MPILQRYSRADFDLNYRLGLWTSDTLLTAIAQHVGKHPQKLALVDGEWRFTRQQLSEIVDCACTWLHMRGVRAGSIVSVQLPNCVHIVAIALALLKLGAVFQPLNASYRVNDVRKIVGHIRPTHYIYPSRFRAYNYAELAREMRLSISIDIDEQPVKTFDTAGYVMAAPAPDCDPDRIYLMCATSGSTGDPKIVMHTQNTQFNEARSLNREMGLGEDDCFLAFSPITHRGVFMWGLCQALTAGAALIIERVYSPAAIIQTVDREQVTSFFAIPTQVAEFLNCCCQGQGGGHSVRVIMMAGARVQPSLVTRIKAQWPECFPITGYGTSETGYAVMTRRGYSLEQLQTCGKPLPGMEVSVDRARAGDGAVGELVLRGAFLSAGYFANQEATDRSYDGEGWFHTGDLGFINAEGNVEVTGRIKNVIIRSGLKIQAEEIEEILLRNPNIVHAVVVGIDHEMTGERAIACLVYRQKLDLSLQSVLAFLDQEGVAKFKWPEGLLVLDALPVNAAGKFDRARLREIATSTS